MLIPDADCIEEGSGLAVTKRIATQPSRKTMEGQLDIWTMLEPQGVTALPRPASWPWTGPAMREEIAAIPARMGAINAETAPGKAAVRTNSNRWATPKDGAEAPAKSREETPLRASDAARAAKG